MKRKFFLWLSIVSALAINISIMVTWEHAYIIWGISICTLMVGIIGTLVCGGGKILFEYLSKIL